MVRLRIGLAYKDREHLNKFQRAIGSDYKLVDNINKAPNGKKFKSSSLYVNSTKMCKDLINLGVDSTKTYNAQIPPISPGLVRHFLRGMFDGDGTISFYNNGVNFSFEISSASRVFVEQLIEIFKKELDININNSVQIINPNEQNYNTTFYKIKVMNIEKNIKIYSYLFNDSHIYLDRKYERVKSFLSKYCPAA